MSNKNRKVIFTLVCVIILIVGGYFGYTKGFVPYKEKVYKQGQVDAIVQLISVAAQCQPVTIPLDDQGNVITLIAQECLG